MTEFSKNQTQEHGNPFEGIARDMELFHAAPTLAEMPRNTLSDKGIEGPTSAHRIEEIHTPLNFAFTTFTTGSTAMQNIVGVTHAELPSRIRAGRLALKRLALVPGSRLLIAYPPLVNVFPRQALDEAGITWSFLHHSGRDALLAAIALEKPQAVLGESSFLRAALSDAQKLGLASWLPKGLCFIAAGTPLDGEFVPVAKTIGADVHDLYGCQEFGWLTLDGQTLREDITLLPEMEIPGYHEVIVGGLPTGDSFPLGAHPCAPGEKNAILTHRRRRSEPGYEATLLQTTVSSALTAQRAARSILRIKARIVRVAPDVVTDAPHTLLRLALPNHDEQAHSIMGPEKTELFDALLEAQRQYQAHAKTDPAWNKGGR